MELTLKLHAWGLAFMVPEGNIQASKGGSHPTVQPSYDTYEPQKLSKLNDSPKGVRVAHKPWW